MVKASQYSLLVVDDEPDLRTLYELTLLREGYDIETAGDVEGAVQHLQGRSYSAVITDMRLPDGSGLDLLRWLETNRRHERAIVITAYGSAENAVEALKAGAYDYLTKPVDLKQFRAAVASALGKAGAAPPALSGTVGPPAAGVTPAAVRRAGAGTAAAASAISPAAQPVALLGSDALRRMAGGSAAMQQLRGLVEKVARSMAPVLVTGESGTGKELVARAIHETSARRGGPFIAVNCGAIPEQLLEAEFFGYRKGAFTGAADDREGFFQAAGGGTLFLDEIGDLPLSMQSKLLRAIQERAVRPIGVVAEVAVDVRLLSATHKDLAAEVQTANFRQDLYYRLNVIPIRVPPLRERIEDLGEIGAKVLERIAVESGADALRLTRDALVFLQRYAFPGNVRELENLLHRAVALSGSEAIDVFDLGLPESVFTDSAAQELDLITRNTRGELPLRPPVPTTPGQPASAASLPPPAQGLLPARSSSVEPLPDNLEHHLDDIERGILERALERHRYNRTAAGASLGLSLRQMRYRMARLGVMVGSDNAAGIEAERA